MIVTKNKCLANKLRLLRNYGTESDYQMSSIGLNARMSEVHAIFGLESLSTFPERQKHRIALTEEYKSHLPDAAFQETTDGCVHAFKDFAILLGEKKDKVKKALNEKQIPFKEYFRPISNLNAYYGTLTPQRNAWNVYQSVIQVPLHDNLQLEDVAKIGRLLSSIIGKGTSAFDGSDTIAHSHQVTLSRPKVSEGVQSNSKS
jgi:dTDP-4-amino-4,6-dideoxygalactose transaminase